MQHRQLSLVLILLALSIKIIVPQGYMFTVSGKTLVVALCSGMAGETVRITIPTQASPADSAPGKARHDGTSGGSTVPDPCPYAALAHGALAGANAVLLAAAIAFILALGFAATACPPIRRIAWLTPPLRGPPLFA